MTDLLFCCGPVICKPYNSLVWQRPTKVFCKPMDGTNNGAYFNSLANPKPNALWSAAGVPEGDRGALMLAAFSAGHQFVNPMLKDPAGFEAVKLVSLADACFLGEGATEPHLGFAAFAKEAAAGRKMMLVTSNGPLDSAIHYGDPATGKQYNLTGGGQCVKLFWNRATGGAEGNPEPVPAGMPTPTFGRRIGNLIWFHYETAPAGKNPHSWHTTDLANPLIQSYGVPWVASEGWKGALPGIPSVGGSGVKALVPFVVGAALGYAAGSYLSK